MRGREGLAVFLMIAPEAAARLARRLHVAGDELDHQASRAARAGAVVGATAAVARLREAAAWCGDWSRDVTRRTASLWPQVPASTTVPTTRDSWLVTRTRAYQRDGAVAARFIAAGLAPPSADDVDDHVLAMAPGFLDRRLAAAATLDAWRRYEAIEVARVATGRYDGATRHARRAGEHVDRVALRRNGRLTASEVAAILDGLDDRQRAIAAHELSAWAATVDPRSLDAVDRHVLREALAPAREALAAVAGCDAAEALEVRRAPLPFEVTTALGEGMLFGAAGPVDDPDAPRRVTDARLVGEVLGGELGLGVADVRDAVAHVAAGELRELPWDAVGLLPAGRLVRGLGPGGPAVADASVTAVTTARDVRADRARRRDERCDADPAPNRR